MKIVVLMENTACRTDLTAEHGLSLYIETGNRKILFDAGQSAVFADNAEKLGVDLARVDTAILSHGHYDHGGGLLRFLELNDTAPIYMSRHAFGPHYHRVGKYIGLDAALGFSDRIRFTCEDQTLEDGIHLVTRIVCDEPIEPYGLTRLENGVHLDEDFRHEQYLLVREGEKTVLFSGCSHRGILNIAQWFRPDILVGGFHFKALPTQGQGKTALERAAGQLLTYPTVYYTGPCTGEEQFAVMKEIMGDRLFSISTGMVLEF